jgi:flagellar biosynthesis protein FlhF
MRLRSFTASSLPDAMDLVRRQLGDEAVILSTQDLGERGVRVTAGLDDDPEDRQGQNEEAALVAVEELSEVFDFHRVPPGLVDKLLTAASNLTAQGPQLMLAGALDAVLHFAPPPLPHPGGAVRAPILLVGPSGAGKTATAAKLCARARLANRPATLITLDTVSAGAREQAQAFAKALGVPLREAPDIERLGAVLGDCPSDHLIVIDTVGVNPYDLEDCKPLRLAARVARAEPLLVLPAGGDAMESAEVAIAFQELGARGLIATRLDAARRLGGLLAAAHAAGLPLVGAGLGPSIGSGLANLNPLALARLLLPEDLEGSLLATGTRS